MNIESKTDVASKTIEFHGFEIFEDAAHQGRTYGEMALRGYTIEVNGMVDTIEIEPASWSSMPNGVPYVEAWHVSRNGDFGEVVEGRAADAWAAAKGLVRKEF